MTAGPVALLPLLGGGPTISIGTLLVIVVLLLIARAVFGIAVKLLVIAAVVLGVLWLLGIVSTGSLGLAHAAL